MNHVKLYESVGKKATFVYDAEEQFSLVIYIDNKLLGIFSDTYISDMMILMDMLGYTCESLELENKDLIDWWLSLPNKKCPKTLDEIKTRIEGSKLGLL